MNKSNNYRKLPDWLTVAAIVTIILTSCKGGKGDMNFEVSGSIVNTTAKKAYLEELSVETMNPVVVDSADISSDGEYKLAASTEEETIFNIRLDQQEMPVASLVNDKSKVELDIVFSKENNRFPEKYEVKGSPASEEMKKFMIDFNGELQKLFLLSQRGDSLHKSGAPDSVMAGLIRDYRQQSESIHNSVRQYANSSTSPAAALFMVGYYQKTASNRSLGLMGFEEMEINEIIKNVAAKFPEHKRLASLKEKAMQRDKQLVEELMNKKEASWVGKPAPEIELPDPNGKPVKLSSFRGKYVLVDFWASWCGPCRNENPNVVNAYNKFKGKNFTILGVSLDRPGQKDKWVKAIMDDGLTWTHVSDLQYWSSPVVPLYKIDGIPYNVLVDPQGTVIAEGLRGSDLESKLAEVVK